MFVYIRVPPEIIPWMRVRPVWVPGKVHRSELQIIGRNTSLKRFFQKSELMFEKLSLRSKNLGDFTAWPQVSAIS